MRLELGHRENVAQQAASLVEGMDERVLSIAATAASERPSLYAKLLEDVRTYEMYCASLHGLPDVRPATAEFVALLEGLSDDSIALNDKIGGLLMHAVGSFRHVLAANGNARAIELVTKVLTDLARVMAAIRKNSANRKPLTANQTVTATVPNPVPAPDKDSGSRLAAQYQEMFLRDESFAEVEDLCQKLKHNPSQLATDQEILNELFRLFHTIKGNAGIVGFKGIMDFAHSIEDRLQAMRAGTAPRDGAAARELVEAGAKLKSMLAQHGQTTETAQDPKIIVTSNLSHAEQVAIAGPNVAEERTGFYLRVQIAGKQVLIPSESVAEVLRRPQILAVPGGHKGWLGLIRCRGRLVPLVDSGAVVTTTDSGRVDSTMPTWTVVLKGKMQSNGNTPLFSVLADDVGEVVEFAFGQAIPNAILLDLSKLDSSNNPWA